MRAWSVLGCGGWLHLLAPRHASGRDLESKVRQNVSYRRPQMHEKPNSKMIKGYAKSIHSTRKYMVPLEKTWEDNT